MFKDYEDLVCEICKRVFSGRRSSDPGRNLCSICLSKDELPVVNEGDNIPDEVVSEMEGGRNANGEN